MEEVLHFLEPENGAQFFDGTVGEGGHANAILSRVLPRGRILGVDRDIANLSTAKERLAQHHDRATLVHGSYADAKKIAHAHDFTDFNGVLLDLGYSSVHVDDAKRGFSFQQEGPLDMRYDTSQELNAEEIVNTWDEEELARIFRRYGEERFARNIAQEIIQSRKQSPFTTTVQLADLVKSVVTKKGQRSKIHPATRVFQALRIAVNDEFGELNRALPDLVDLLAPEGRVGIISFHSLEDRIVKHFFENEPRLTTITKRVVKPKIEEIRRNPRSRSAKLRVAQRV